MRIRKTAYLIIALLLIAGSVQAQSAFDAVFKKDLAKLKEIVDKDPNWVKLTAKDQKMATLLHFAAILDHPEIAAYLIDKGADMNTVRTDYFTPLMLAGPNVTKVLVERGADLNYSTPEGITAVYFAASTADQAVFEYLMDHGAKLPEPGTYGAAICLEYGLSLGNVKCFEASARQGLDPLFKNNAGMTLAHFAAESLSLDLFRRLAEYGAPLGQTDVYGWTPLHKAAWSGNLPIVEFLIKAGLDKDARTVDGKTAYLLAKEKEMPEVAAYLSSIGADTSAARLPVLTGEYFGQPLPGKTPRPFVPGFPDIQEGVHGIFAFSPNGKEAYWKPVWSPNTALRESKMEDGRWTEPKISPFSAEIQGDDAPFISPDGKKLFFVSQRPNTGKELPFPYVEKIWMMDKTTTGWTKPRKVSDTVNAVEGMHWQLSADLLGSLYFGASGDIYCAAFKDGAYAPPEKLGPAVNNGKEGSFSPYISPDGGYLLFSRTVPLYTYQIFASFKKTDGSWTDAINLAPVLKQDFCLNPRVTPDGKYLFFSGRHGVTYWVEASILESLKPRV